VEIDDRHVLPSEARHRRPDVVEGHGANVAQVLRDDHVRPRGAKPLHVDVVDGESVPEDAAHGSIDRPTRGERPDARGRKNRDVLEARRKVAFMRPAEQVGPRAEGADDLRG